MPGRAGRHAPPDETAAAAPTGRRWSRMEHDERRAQILATSRKLFSERPYAAVSTTELASAAGVTRGLLHHYFGSKRELYLEAVRSMVRGPMAGLSGPDIEAGRAWEDSVDAWMDLIAANRDMWFDAIGAGETGRDRALHEILDEAREATATQVLRVLGLDHHPSPQLRALVRGFGSLAEEVTREWLERGRLSRAQARTLLCGSLPLMIDQLLPAVEGATGSTARAGRAADRTGTLSGGRSGAGAAAPRRAGGKPSSSSGAGTRGRRAAVPPGTGGPP